ncbi:MAG: exodeoxyribonuclease VII small subunit [Nitrospirota bacterium]
MKNELKFEVALSKLEEIVQKLESGDLSLEDSLKVFEEGVTLSRNCAKILHDAEKRVTRLTAPKEGEDPAMPEKEIQAERPLQIEEDSEEAPE